MNPEAKEELDRILGIELNALSESEQAFLQARRSYLTEEQKTVYGITEPKEASQEAENPEETTEETSEKKPAKKLKK